MCSSGNGTISHDGTRMLGHSRAQPGTAAQCFCDEKTFLVFRAMLEIMVQLKMIFSRRNMTIEMTETNHGNICHGFSSKREGWQLIRPRLDLFEQRSPSFQASELILIFLMRFQTHCCTRIDMYITICPQGLVVPAPWPFIHQHLPPGLLFKPTQKLEKNQLQLELSGKLTWSESFWWFP